MSNATRDGASRKLPKPSSIPETRPNKVPLSSPKVRKGPTPVPYIPPLDGSYIDTDGESLSYPSVVLPCRKESPRPPSGVPRSLPRFRTRVGQQ